MNIVAIAASEAADRHKGVKRKYNGSPYIYHPMRVAGRAQILGMSDDAVAALWLHDVPEDTAKDAADRDFLIKHIGDITTERTARIVLGLTDPTKFDPALKSLRRAERKKHLFDFLAAQDNDVKRGKFLDRIDNLSETTMDMQTGVLRDFKFPLLYADESELLADVLKSSSLALHEELMETIRRVRAAANLLRQQKESVVKEQP